VALVRSSVPPRLGQVVPRSGDEIEIRDGSRSGVVADVHVWLRAVVIAEPDAIVTPNAWKASARSTTGG
jgi:hypothetical protein